MVDTFPQLPDPVSLLRHVARALAPNGRLGIVDFKADGAGGPGPPLEERLDPEVIKRDAASAGLVLRRQETFLRYQYFLVFENSGRCRRFRPLAQYQEAVGRCSTTSSPLGPRQAVESARFSSLSKRMRAVNPLVAADLLSLPICPAHAMLSTT
jgi:hypothetical protein